MISVQEALDLILAQSFPQENEEVDLLDAMGGVLAEPVKADRDAPPFHRVTMDGIAIHSNALKENSSFKIENIQSAGKAQQSLINSENCIEVMTGAVLPKNTDCVVPYEQITLADGVAFLDSNEHVPYQNVHLSGTDAKTGDTLLTKGQSITPAIIGTLASVGISRIRVHKLPKIAICSTGDELVDLDQEPEIHQIRKSNAYMLHAALLDFGIKPNVFHLRDDKEEMMDELATLVKDYQILLFSGAVSKGKYDYLPMVLQELGMNKIIHGVAQRPGKPFLFGVLPNSMIFGFPGNPASTFVCFHTYFKPWLRQYLGLPGRKYTAVLDQDISFKKPLTYHLLVTLSIKEGSILASPLKSSGSGDLVHLAHADAVISLPLEREMFHAGEIFPLNPLGKNLL
ncbi:MAG: molybdopterin molybdotransferase MoeA [Anditalea sp.]